MFSVNGAMASMQSEALELLNDAYTLETLEDKHKVILKINQCLCDEDPSTYNRSPTPTTSG